VTETSPDVCILTRVPITEDPEPRPDGEEPDPFADLVLDEEFVKGATVKEESGRARMLSARWKKEPPQPTEAWRPPTEIRRSRFGRKAKRVDPWGNPKRKKGRGAWQAPVFVLLTIAVVAAGLNVNALHTWYQNDFGGNHDNGAMPAAPASQKPVATQAPETAAPTAAPSTQAPEQPTVAQPWLGSPAAAWPVGADGIQLPQAQSVGVFSQSEVTQNLAMVKKYLVASNLDPSVVDGGASQPVLDLMDSQDRQDLSAALAHPDKDHDPTDWISRFDPKTAVRAVQDVRVQGHVSFEGDGDKGLLVHTDYIFVYALVPGPEQFHPSDQPSAAASTGNAQSVSLVQLDPAKDVVREIVRRTQDFRFYDPQRYQVDPGKIVLGKGSSNFGGNYCASGGGWLQPVFEDDSAGRPGNEPSGPAVDPYDGSKPLQGGGGCNSASRT
jgi:hypothetical protein